MSAVELRVHGVSGTPPQSLLDRPLVHQVAGDRIAGFYVPRLAAESTDAAPRPGAPEQPDAPELVGYCWGGLTSGSPGRALWLLLLPFTFLNVAPRARPATTTDSRPFRTVWWIWYLSRLLALSLTVLFTLTGIGVGVDLLGWQCAGTTVCQGTAPDWLVQQDITVEGTLLLGALVPMAVLGLLWLVSYRTANRYESAVANLAGYRPHISAEGHPQEKALEVGLPSPLMWHNAAPVRRLRAVHMQCGFATILAAVLAPTDMWSLTVASAVVLAYALVVLGSPSFTGHGASRKWRFASWTVWVVLTGSGVAAAGCLVAGRRHVRAPYLGLVADGRREGLPFFDAFVLADSAAAVLLLLALIAVVGIAGRARSPIPSSGGHAPLAPGLGGFACPALAALGVFLAAAFTAGTYVYAATVLHTGSVKPSFHELTTIHAFVRVPNTVAVATLAYTTAVLALAAMLLIAIGYVGLRLWLWPGNADRAMADYASPPDTPDGAKRSRQIRRAMFSGTLVDAAPWLLGPLVGIGLVIVLGWGTWLGFHTGAAPRCARPDRHCASVFGSANDVFSRNYASGLGAYLAVLTLLGLVAIGAVAFRVPATRRGVGILWDVASFWPRACHPLAAPCYAERTVPDLITYLTHRRVAAPDTAVVLAAHSQGSVISAATILQLHTYDTAADEDAGAGDHQVRVLPRVAFLSFGCVLRRLYGRYFPVYFGAPQLERFQQILTTGADPDRPIDPAAAPRWINLWRYTDYLGGQVTAGPPQRLALPDRPPDASFPIRYPPTSGPTEWEWHAPDPPRFDRVPGDATYSRPQRHSNYWADESGYFQLAVHRLIEQIQGQGM